MKLRKTRSFYFQLVCLLSILTTQMCYSSSVPSEQDKIRISDYLGFLQNFNDHLGTTGDYSRGEIQIVLDPDKIAAIEDQQIKVHLKRGVPKHEAKKWSEVGIINVDDYLIWLRDAVVFPSGCEGTYDRIIWKSSVDGPGNVVILPVLKNRKIILNLIYRHSTRSWEIELARGLRLYGETPEKACKRELRDETGCLTERVEYLGAIAPDTSTVSTVTPVFLGYVSEQVSSNHDETEAIHGLITLTKNEIKDAFVRGHFEINIQGEIQKVPFRDSFLAFAILQAEARGLI